MSLRPSRKGTAFPASVLCLLGEPNQRVSNAPLRALRGHLAHPVLHFLQTPADAADGIDCDLRVSPHQIHEFGLAPTGLDSFSLAVASAG